MPRIPKKTKRRKNEQADWDLMMARAESVREAMRHEPQEKSLELFRSLNDAERKLAILSVAIDLKLGMKALRDLAQSGEGSLPEESRRLLAEGERMLAESGVLEGLEKHFERAKTGPDPEETK